MEMFQVRNVTDQMGIVRSEILCGRSNSMQEYYCWQLSGLNLLRREFYILLFYFRPRQISYGGMSQGGNCRVVFITVASVHFVSIRIVVSDKSMVRKFYGPNKNTKYFKHTFLTHLFPPFQHLLSERLTSLGIMGEPRVTPLNPSESIVLSEHYRL